MFAGNDAWWFPTGVSRAAWDSAGQRRQGREPGPPREPARCPPTHSPTVPFNPLVATEDGAEPGGSSDVEQRTAQAHPPHTAATFTRNGERTLRSLANASTTSGDVGRSAVVPGETDGATPQGDVPVTGDARLVSGSRAASPAPGGERLPPLPPPGVPTAWKD